MEQSANGHTPARVYLQPIAAPSILGLYGFAGATLILASHVVGWWGDAQSTAYIWPFAAAFGGVAQFVAGMWAYKARDAIALPWRSSSVALRAQDGRSFRAARFETLEKEAQNLYSGPNTRKREHTASLACRGPHVF